MTDKAEKMRKKIDEMIVEWNKKEIDLNKSMLYVPEWFVQELIKSCIGIIPVEEMKTYRGIKVEVKDIPSGIMAYIQYETKIIDRLYIKMDYYDGYSVDKMTINLDFDMIFVLKDLVFRKHG